MFRHALAFSLLAASAATAEPFTIAALGDAPYGVPEEVYAPYEALIGAINAVKPQLVIHVGDIKAGSTPCSDALITDQRDFLNRFDAPVLYTPGDNEWTDCHRKAAGGFDPLERLAFLRKTFFAAPKTLGKTPVDVTSQAAAGYPENTRLTINDVTFMGVHVVGSNNNFEIRDIKAVEEFMARDKANLAWLEESFAAAKDAKAVVVAIQADIFEFDWNAGEEGFLRHSGFANFSPKLIELSAAFGKPVLLVYGDSHVYRNARPFPTKAPNVMALEVPGEAEMHAVEVTIDPATSGVFATRLIRNPAIRVEG
ncbi:MAG: metallophosphoesterase [Paracoccaceae bacterium]